MVCIYLPRRQGDEPSARMLIANLLEQLGYIAIKAADDAGGLRVLQPNVPIDGLPGGMKWATNDRRGARRPFRPESAVHHRICQNALLTNGRSNQVCPF
jgi:hypothetical protein